MLESGGNAADAATACALTLMVTDPANASPAGRCQIIFRNGCAEPKAINGTTFSSKSFSKQAGQRPIPIPGAVSALVDFHSKNGRLPLSEVAGSALNCARNGFVLGAEQAAIWKWRQPDLVGTNLEKFFLPSGNSPNAGEVFHNPGIANFFDRFIKLQKDPYRDAEFVKDVLIRMKDAGVPWSVQEAIESPTMVGQVICRKFDLFKVWTIGKQGWGHTLIDILDRYFNSYWDERFSQEIRLILSILHAVLGRQIAGKFGTQEAYCSNIEDEIFDRSNIDFESLAKLIKKNAGDNPQLFQAKPDQDTTALAVCDKEENFVSITQSIGPHFGSKVFDAETGVIFAHSYQMDNCFLPSSPDVTELCPSILEMGDKTVALGAAGSERIPGAVASVICNLANGKSLFEAISAPRSNVTNLGVRIHDELRIFLEDELKNKSIHVEFTDHGPIDHLGIVHAVGNLKGGNWEAEADPAYSGLGLLAKQQ